MGNNNESSDSRNFDDFDSFLILWVPKLGKGVVYYVRIKQTRRGDANGVLIDA